MDARKLVGMTQGARKRAAWQEATIAPHRFTYGMGIKVYRMGHRLRPCPGCTKCLRCLCGNSAACIGLYEAWTKHQKAEPSCNDCCGHGCEDGHCDKVYDICDGSGVITAKARKVRR
jgi:hypothetical protein